MKFNLSTLTISIGLTVGAISYANVAQARLALNGSSLTGQASQPASQNQTQPETETLTLARLALNGSSLTGQVSRPTSQEQPQTETKALSVNGSSLDGANDKSK